jgi:PAS domain S-box-containing protein
VALVQGREVSDVTQQLADHTIWQRIFDAVPDLVFILDDQHRILLANRAAAARLECSPDAMLRQSCARLMHGTDEPPEFCPHTCLLRDGQSHSVQLFEPTLHSHFDVSVTPLQDDCGKVIGAVHVARDVSRLKRAEERLRQARDEIQQRYALTVAASLGRIVGLGHDGRSRRILVPVGDVVGVSTLGDLPTYDFFRSILHPDDAAAVDAAITQHLLDREPFEIEYRLRHRDGQYRWFLARGQATGTKRRDGRPGWPVRFRTSATASRPKRHGKNANDSSVCCRTSPPDLLAACRMTWMRKSAQRSRRSGSSSVPIRSLS